MTAVNLKMPPLFPEDEPITTEHFYHTNIKQIKCSFTWTINHFSSWLGKMGDCLTTPKFSANNDGTKWSLEFYPKGINSNAAEFVSLYLKLESSNKVNAKVKFSIINLKPEANKVFQYEYEFTKEGEICGYPRMINQEYLFNTQSGFLPEDKLTILCEVCVDSGSDNTSWKNHIINIPKSQLAKDYGTMFNNKLLSDVTLLVGDHKFKAHKVILAARSPVFAAMFTHEMKEHEQNLVDVEDVDVEVFEEMLQFIYTETAPNLDKMAKKLLSVADKYLLENLKIMSENKMYESLTIETAGETLLLADLHSANQLKDQTLKFINSHLSEVGNTSSFKNMIATHPTLAVEIISGCRSSQINYQN